MAAPPRGHKGPEVRQGYALQANQRWIRRAVAKGGELDADLEARLTAIEDALSVPSFLMGDQVFFTADDTFTKANYPGLRAVRIRVQGGGGAGGGAASTAAAQNAFPSGGGGGGYAEAFVLEADLAAAEAVTVGAGGTGVSGADGNAGADSIFDTVSGEVRGVGGGGGTTMTAGTSLSHVLGAGSGGGTGDFVVTGMSGMHSVRYSSTSGDGALASGGPSHLGPGGRGRLNATGDAAGAYGGGGGAGANNASQSARTGGAGGIGLVIVELFF